MATPSTIPQARQQVLQAGGQMDRLWYRFLDTLDKLTGGGTINISGLPSSIEGAEVIGLTALTHLDPQPRIEMLEKRVAQLEALVLMTISVT